MCIRDSHNIDKGYPQSHTGNVKTCTSQSIYLGEKSLCSLWKNYSARKFNFSSFFISFPQFLCYPLSSTLSLGALSEREKCAEFNGWIGKSSPKDCLSIITGCLLHLLCFTGYEDWSTYICSLSQNIVVWLSGLD